MKAVEGLLSVPHARGDEPRPLRKFAFPFPTPVGMNRLGYAQDMPFPTPVGMNPKGEMELRLLIRSPRPWG